MEIKAELVKNAIMEYIEDTFAALEFNLGNVGSLMIAKIFVDRKFDSMVSLIGDTNGMIPVDLIEKYGTEAINKLGSIDIPKLNGKLVFRNEDFIRLMSKIKSKGERE